MTDLVRKAARELEKTATALDRALVYVAFTGSRREREAVDAARIALVGDVHTIQVALDEPVDDPVHEPTERLAKSVERLGDLVAELPEPVPETPAEPRPPGPPDPPAGMYPVHGGLSPDYRTKPRKHAPTETPGEQTGEMPVGTEIDALLNVDVGGNWDTPIEPTGERCTCRYPFDEEDYEVCKTCGLPIVEHPTTKTPGEKP